MKSFSHQKSILKKSLFRPHRIQTKFPRIRSLGFPENCKTIFYKLRFNPHHRCLKSQLIFRQNDFFQSAELLCLWFSHKCILWSILFSHCQNCQKLPGGCSWFFRFHRNLTKIQFRCLEESSCCKSRSHCHRILWYFLTSQKISLSQRFFFRWSHTQKLSRWLQLRLNSCNFVL